MGVNNYPSFKLPGDVDVKDRGHTLIGLPVAEVLLLGSCNQTPGLDNCCLKYWFCYH